MKIPRFAFLLVFVAAMTALAADVTGSWVAQVPMRGEVMETTFTFKVDGAKLTGSVNNQLMPDVPISDGKVEGDTVSFVQNLEFNGNSIKISYKGKVSGNEIAFTREVEGRGNPQNFTAKKK